MRYEHPIQSVLQTNKAVVTSYLVLDDDVREFTGDTLNIAFCDSKLGRSEPRVQSLVSDRLSSTAPG